MKMRKSIMLKKCIVLLGLSLLAAPCLASKSAQGKVTVIGGQTTGQPSIYFGLDTAPLEKPACSDHNAYFYVIDPSTDEGKALYSMLLYAKAQDKKLSVKGTGVCILGQPAEAVHYWTLLD